jgi:serine/threonine protein kinase
VKVHDAGDWTGNSVYVASEYCSGGSLEDLSKTVPLDPSRACELVSQGCRGLDVVHRSGLLHLDIRPANILIGGDGKPRLIDFGLARWTHDPNADEWYWPHAAPELVERSQGQVATDIYGMAMTLAHLLTAGAICRPFLSGIDLVDASANGEWPRLDELGVNVPKKLRSVIEAGVQYDPDKRPATIEAFKKLVDKATPAISFSLQDDGSLASTAHGWTITMVRRNGSHDVEVRTADRTRILGADHPDTVRTLEYLSFWRRQSGEIDGSSDGVS